MNIDGKTIQLAVIGNPIEHTFSPAIHNYIAAQEGDNCIYGAWRVLPEDLADAVKGVRALNVRGINVTIPHKIEIMKYLDEISTSAALLGSVNTVVNRDGRLCGYNTDADGFYKAISNAGAQIEDADVLMIGAGGVVLPLLLKIIEHKPKSVTLVNRSENKARKLRETAFERTGFKVGESVEKERYGLVINTTSAGMAPQLDALPIDAIEGIESLDFIDRDTFVTDLIYNPEETKFLKEAKMRGAKILNGLDMLINQATLAYEIFMDKKLPDDMGERIKKGVFGR